MIGISDDGFAEHTCENKQLSLWYCAVCRRVRLRTGEVALSFDSREFAAFTNAVVDVYYSAGWEMSQWVLPQAGERDEILTSELID
ncbi:MAG: hypothetical protein IPM50_02550 [Acidobacteriota bacterium]|nr:MAG: hypothetical protein IPM50_02550 [Acidobacteriota bacterium]